MESQDVHLNWYMNDNAKVTKMTLIYNALEDGWAIEKKGKNYTFSKTNENKKEVIDENFLPRFFKEYLKNK